MDKKIILYLGDRTYVVPNDDIEQLDNFTYTLNRDAATHCFIPLITSNMVFFSDTRKMILDYFDNYGLDLDIKMDLYIDSYEFLNLKGQVDEMDWDDYLLNLTFRSDTLFNKLLNNRRNLVDLFYDNLAPMNETTNDGITSRNRYDFAAGNYRFEIPELRLNKNTIQNHSRKALYGGLLVINSASNFNLRYLNVYYPNFLYDNLKLYNSNASYFLYPINFTLVPVIPTDTHFIVKYAGDYTLDINIVCYDYMKFSSGVYHTNISNGSILYYTLKNTLYIQLNAAAPIALYTSAYHTWTFNGPLEIFDYEVPEQFFWQFVYNNTFTFVIGDTVKIWVEKEIEESYGGGVATDDILNQFGNRFTKFEVKWTSNDYISSGAVPFGILIHEAVQTISDYWTENKLKITSPDFCGRPNSLSPYSNSDVISDTSIGSNFVITYGSWLKNALKSNLTYSLNFDDLFTELSNIFNLGLKYFEFNENYLEFCPYHKCYTDEYIMNVDSLRGRENYINSIDNNLIYTSIKSGYNFDKASLTIYDDEYNTNRLYNIKSDNYEGNNEYNIECSWITSTYNIKAVIENTDINNTSFENDIFLIALNPDLISVELGVNNSNLTQPEYMMNFRIRPLYQLFRHFDKFGVRMLKNSSLNIRPIFVPYNFNIQGFSSTHYNSDIDLLNNFSLPFAESDTIPGDLYKKEYVNKEFVREPIHNGISLRTTCYLTLKQLEKIRKNPYGVVKVNNGNKLYNIISLDYNLNGECNMVLLETTY